MADDIKLAVRIITDLRTPPALEKPKEAVVWRSELYREVGALARADLELARMLDELDAKINSHDAAVMTFATGVHEALESLQHRCDVLEARTIAGRIRRLRAWWDEALERIGDRIFEFVWLADGNELPAPIRPERKL